MSFSTERQTDLLPLVPSGGPKAPESTMLIVSSDPQAMAPFPIELPPSVMEILEAYDDGRPDGDIADLRRIMALDAHYHADDPRLFEIRRQQAEGLKEHIERVGAAIRYNEFFLGFLLIYANEHQLHTYVSCPDLIAWCHDLGITDDKLIQKAMALAEVYPFMHDLGLSVEDVVDGSITPGIKTNKIKSLARKAPEVLLQYQLEEVRASHPDLLTQPSERKNARAVVDHAISTLDKDEQAAIRERVEHKFIEEALQQVQEIRELREGDLILEQQIKQGEPQRALITMRCTWQHGQLFFDAGSFACGPAEVAALQKNQYTLRFDFEGVEGLISPRDLGDALSVFVTPYGYTPPSSFDDDEEDTHRY